MSSHYESVAKRINGYKDFIIDLERRLTAIQALDPTSGGDGESEKAQLILELLENAGITDVELIKANDDRVSAGYRPNIVARIPGQDHSKTLWLMSHMDVVPTGDLENWESDPWTIKVEGQKIYGRGVEDNQQGLVASLCLAQALHDEKIIPPYDLGLLFVADEETGNQMGIEYVLEHHKIFQKEDLIVVPDGGEPDGSMIEVAEKGILWLKCIVKGKSAHGSTPERGINAHLVGAKLILALDAGLHGTFHKQDHVFDPPASTFAVTKVDPGAPNVNTIPGEHTFYLDCRVIPDYNLNDVLEKVVEIAAEVDFEGKTKTTFEIVQRMDSAPPTSLEAPVVLMLKKAISAVYGVQAKAMGVGGGTVAAFIRRKGYNAAVWARMDETMHGPNEYCIIDNLIGDAKVFAHILLE